MAGFTPRATAKHHAELYERFLDRVEAHKPVLSPEQIYFTVDEFRASLEGVPRLEVEELDVAGADSAPIYLSSQSTRKYHGNIRELISDLKKFHSAGEKVAFILSNLGRAERLNDILKEYEIPAHFCRTGDEDETMSHDSGGRILLGVGNLHAGYFLPAINLRVLTSQDLFDEADVGVGPKKTKAAHRNIFISDFRDLKPGDYVVHVDHGIGLFNGLKTIGIQEGSKEFVLLTYQDDARLYVPVERLDLIQKYSSMGGSSPNSGPVGRNQLGPDEIPHQEIDAGYGGRAFETLCPAPDGARLRLLPRHGLAAGIR